MTLRHAAPAAALTGCRGIQLQFKVRYGQQARWIRRRVEEHVMLSKLRRAPNQLRPGAFTLVELLVVIGIIAVLISILLSALSKARAAGKQTQCMNLMRQYGTAFTMYANDNKGAYPYPGHDSNNVNMWTYQLFRGKYYGFTFFQLADYATNPGTAGLGEAVLKKIYCPEMWSSDRRVPGWPGSEADWCASGNINTIGYAYSYGLRGRKAASLKNSSSRMLLIEHLAGFAVTPLLYSTNQNLQGTVEFSKKYGYYAFRHKGFINVLFLDGHVDGTFKGPKSLPPYDNIFWNDPGT